MIIYNIIPSNFEISPNIIMRKSVIISIHSTCTNVSLNGFEKRIRTEKYFISSLEDFCAREKIYHEVS